MGGGGGRIWKVIRATTPTAFLSTTPTAFSAVGSDRKPYIGNLRVYHLWMNVVNADSFVEKNRAWDFFKRGYKDIDGFLAYMEKEWMDMKTSQRFLRCFTKNYLHLGNSATSRNEATHWILKQELQVSKK